MFIFNEHDFSADFRVNDIKRSILPPVYDDLLVVPARDGAHDFGSRFGVLYITFYITLRGVRSRNTIRELAGNLHTMKLKPLIIKDEPDKYYEARLSTSTNLDEIVEIGRGAITFLCPDPYAYDLVQTEIDFENDEASIDNTGTAEAYPRTTVEFNHPSTFLGIITPDHHLLIGDPQSADDTPVPLEELILHDTCSTTVGWTTGNAVDGGIITGAMVSDGGKFVAADYGSGANWHGPAIKRSLPGTVQLQDFQVDIMLELDSRNNRVGRAEIYLLDAANNTIGKVAFKDIRLSTEIVEPEGRAGALSGGEYFVPRRSIYNFNRSYSSAEGYVLFLRLKRVGIEWEAWAAWRRPDWPSFLNPQRAFFSDVEEEHMGQLAQVQVHLGQNGSNEPAEQSINDIKVYRINDPDAIDNPYIFNPGDVVEIDHMTGLVLKNGEEFMEYWDPGGEFFSLPKGQTVLKIVPEGVTQATLAWQRRWK